jgi:uncharacterized protein YkwD
VPVIRVKRNRITGTRFSGTRFSKQEQCQLGGGPTFVYHGAVTASHAPVRCLRVVAAAAALVVAHVAAADVVAIVNDIRSSGCRSATPVASVARDAALEAAARLIARGSEVAQALEQSGYRAARTNLINIGGAADDAAIREVLADGFCDDVINRAYTSAGVYERGREFWLVLAAPFAPIELGSAGTAEERVLELVNEARAEGRRCGRRRFGAAKPLTLSAALTRAAAAHAADMAANAFMGHVGSDGSSAAERVSRAGYRWRSVGENVAAGHPDADAVVEGWLDSAGHCENIMSSHFAEMGVAFAAAPRSELRILWSQVFAARR